MKNKSLALSAAMAISASFPGIALASGYQVEDPHKPSTRYRRNKVSPAKGLQERARLARIKEKQNAD